MAPYFPFSCIKKPKRGMCMVWGPVFPLARGPMGPLQPKLAHGDSQVKSSLIHRRTLSKTVNKYLGRTKQLSLNLDSVTAYNQGSSSVFFPSVIRAYFSSVYTHTLEYRPSCMSTLPDWAPLPKERWNPIHWRTFPKYASPITTATEYACQITSSVFLSCFHSVPGGSDWVEIPTSRQ